jgi:hypothetical protein
MRKPFFWAVIALAILGSVAAWADLSGQGTAADSMPDEIPIITNAI